MLKISIEGKNPLIRGCQYMRACQTREQLFSQGLKVLQCVSPPPTGISSYIPLKLVGLMAGERLTFPLFIKVSEHREQGFNYFPFTEADEVLEAKWLTLLKKLNIRHLYFHRDDLEGALAYLNNYLLVLEAQGPAQTKRKLKVLGEHLNLTLRQAFDAPRLGPHIQVVQKQIDQVIKDFQRDKSSLPLVWEILSRNYSLYNHSVNVCLMAVALMLFLEKSRGDSRLMGIAALFHDVGMIHVSEEILYKSDALSLAELKETEAHPTTGMMMLQACADVPLEAGRLVWEHHENADGSGYPRGLSLDHQHPWTRILRLVDAFDALTTFRLYRPAYTPYAALKHLQGQEGGQGPIYDLQTLKDLIRFLALT